MILTILQGDKPSYKGPYFPTLQQGPALFLGTQKMKKTALLARDTIIVQGSKIPYNASLF
ncbi:TPA: hypothetical protein TZE17_001130 [Streptococcus suis]|nr:hypothetical protein [Streptococcus suis]HEL2195474.1 hypothetical protein [Streptococcus suis]